MGATRCIHAAIALLVLAGGPAAEGEERFAVIGVVVDAATGAGLVGANLLLEETAQAVACDTGGAFVLTSVPVGVYTLVVSHVGYRTAFRRLEVTGAKSAPVRLRLQPEPVQLQQTLVQADPSASSAGASRPVREFDLRIRPTGSPREVIQVVPGLFTARRAGGGGAEQIFLRGFDSSQGADVAIAVDGMPANLVSHGHGQGYADLGFVIPDVIERVEVYKGPYYAEYGNLANAAQLVIRTRDRLPQSSVRVERGGLNTGRYTALVQLPSQGESSAYFAGDLYTTDGPFEQPQELRRLSLFGKVRRPLSDEAALTVTAGGAAATWAGPGQIPRRAVTSGRVTEWGTVSQGEGGATARHYLNVLYRADSPSGREQLAAEAYLGDYGMRVYANNTYVLQDPIFGDMIEQSDHRWLGGLNLRYRAPHQVGPFSATAALGGGLRTDQIDLELWQVIQRRRYWPLIDAQVGERNYSAWGQEEVVLSPSWRTVLGLRGDYFTFDVEDRLEIDVLKGVLPLTEYLKELRRTAPRGKLLHVPLVQPHASGLAQTGILSPKASLIYSAGPGLEVYGNLGTGFHSNDARSVVIGEFVREQARVLAEEEGATEAEISAILDTLKFDPAQRRTAIIPRTVGGELGMRLRLAGPLGGVLRQLGPVAGHYPGDVRFHAPVASLSGRLNLAGALWWIDVEDEYIYVADTGAQERRGRTRRWGLDLEGRAQLRSWLWGDLDANWAHGRLRDEPTGQDRIPLAPRFTSAGGLTARWSERVECWLRFRHLDDRPATTDGILIAEGYTLFDLSAGYHANRFQLEVAVENLLDRAWREGQFALQSVLPWEGELVLHGPPPPPDIHFSPGNPRNLRVGLRLFY